MEKSFVVKGKFFFANLLTAFILLVVVAALIYFTTNNHVYIAVLWGMAVFLLLMFMRLVDAFKNNFHILKIDERGVKIRNAFAKINNLSWSEIKDVYVYQFTGTDKIRVPYKVDRKGNQKWRKFGMYELGDKLIFVPKGKPTQWIFFDDGRGNSGENIFEYFGNLNKGDTIRLVYNDYVFSLIKKYYQKEIVYKTVEAQELEFKPFRK